MSTTPIINRGSEWRIWDLHIHTPYSINQNYGNTDEGWEKFISALEHLPKEVKVIGITDYYFIDGYERVMRAKSEGRLQNIEKIFPILEFRIDTFGSGNENNLQKINLHVLFDLDEENLANEIQKVKNDFIGCIKLSKDHQTKTLTRDNLAEAGGTLQEGFSSIIPNTDEVFKIIKDASWVDKTFLFLGYKEWSNLQKNQQVKTLKEKLYRQVHAFLNSNALGIEKSQGWLDELQEKIGKKRLIHSLDIHDFDTLDTFEDDGQSGIKDPRNYHCQTWIKADPTFNGLKQIYYEPIERVSISPSIPQDKAGYQVIDSVSISHKEFHPQTLNLNENLNSIIGGRSTGKSLLLGAIAKRLDRHTDVKDNPEYEEFVNEVANSLKIIWKDGKEDDNREIEYFPQSHMYSLAKNSKKLDTLIEKIVRQDSVKNQIIEDYKAFSSSNNTEITDKINRLFQLLERLEKNISSLKERGDEGGIKDEVTKIESELGGIKSKIVITEPELEAYNKLKATVESLNKEIEFITKELIRINTLKNKSFINNEIEYELTALSDSNRTDIIKLFDELRHEYQGKWSTKIQDVVEGNEKLKSQKLEEISKIEKDEAYIKGVEALKNNTQFLELENKLKIQRNKLLEIEHIKKEISEQQTQFENLKKNVLELNKKYLEQIEDFKSNLTEEKDKLKIKAIAKTNFHGFKSILERSLNQQGYKNQGLVSRELKSNDDLFKLIEEIFNELLTGELTLKGGNKPQPLCQELLATNFFDIAYNIVYEKDDFGQMSEGKKAFVVLMLLLDFNKKDCPILIDQPEDDLDNRAIYKGLVKYLIDKKKERQIILVTHNPNIVVGADSELVIVANQHGKDTPNEKSVKFQYKAGSLENSQLKHPKEKIILYSQGIKEHVCEILEGGNDAFKQRELKYDLK